MSTVVDPYRLQQAGSLSIEELLRQLKTQREQELNEARAIQLGMMPRGTLETADVTACYDFQPFHEVGGDFLDFFQLSDQTIGIYLGDVTGKGLPAALYAALAVGTLQGVHKTGTDPAAVLSQLNRRMLLHNISHRYAAVACACFDPRTGVMRISSAGMEGPLHVTAAGCQEMALQGLPPGMFPNASYDSATLRLEPGDSIVFFSDGLSDTKNHAGDFFGKERIREVCSSMLRATPQEQLNAIRSAVKAHAEGETQQDDRAIAVLSYRPSWQTGNRDWKSN
jgi:sigma-B regulation protein RsbU (phosphoserine phosphatase)